MKTKKCNTCKKTKEIKSFIPTSSKNGYSAKCRDCTTIREKELRSNRAPDKVCPSCKKTRSSEMFEKRRRKCNFCIEKDSKISEAKLQNMGDLRETQYRLKNKAKLSLEELKEVEKEKLKNGYTWIDEQREYGKVRVLRKIK